MKFLSIVILSCLAFSSVHGASELSTDFEELGEMFDQGTLPTKEETFGWWSGRCYDVLMPSNPLPNLLVSRMITDEPSKTHQMVFLRHGSKQAADYFDNNLLEFKVEVEELINTEENRRIIVKKRDNSLYAYTPLNLDFALRKYENYFIGQAIVNQDGSTSNGKHRWRAGDVYSNCYFFKKVY